MSNVISFVGRVGKDAEINKVSKSEVLNFTICNNVGYGNNQTANWFQCAIWGKRATSLLPHISKGKELFISGELTIRKYTDKQGAEKFSPSISVNVCDFVGGKGQGGGGQGGQGQAPSSPETSEDMPF